MILKPAPSVVWNQALRALVLGIPGLAIAWGAGSAGKPIGVLVGILLVGLAVFMVVNKLTIRVRLKDGVLRSRSLFEEHSVEASDVTAIVPVELTIELTSWSSRLLNRRRPPGTFLDVRTAGGSTGIWLNPRVYGAANVAALLSELHLEPRREVEHWTRRY